MMTDKQQDGMDSLTSLYLHHLQQQWKAEIERAMDRIKNRRTAWDKRFRKEWHRVKWYRIHGWKPTARRASRGQEWR